METAVSVTSSLKTFSTVVEFVVTVKCLLYIPFILLLCSFLRFLFLMYHIVLQIRFNFKRFLVIFKKCTRLFHVISSCDILCAEYWGWVFCFCILIYVVVLVVKNLNI